MNALRRGIRDGLRNDPEIEALVGRDADNEVKVYGSVGKRRADAPFIVWRLISGDPPEGTYKDRRAIEMRMVQITSWGRTGNEAWQLHDAVQVALERLEQDDILFTPYSLMRVGRLGDEQELEDIETTWTQIPVTYQFALSR